MKFYEIQINGETVGCEFTLAAAKKVAQDHDPDWCIIAQDIPVTAESIRLLLANQGGYANDVRVIDPCIQEAA